MRKIVEFLEEMFRHDSFAQFVPVERTCVITQDDAGEKGWEEITEWAETVRDRVSDHAEFKVKGWTIRDHGACYCERFPCPLPHVEVLTEKSIWRYAVTAFFDGKSALLSCKRLSNGDSVPVAGVNLDSGAAWLTNEIRRLCLPMLCRKTVVLDRRPQIKARLKSNKSWIWPIAPDALAEGIRSALDIEIFLMIHTTEVALSSFIPDEVKPFYYAEVACSGVEQTAKLQTETLRKMLAAFTFAQGLEAPIGMVPEITMQAQGDLELLQKVKSVPVLAHVDQDGVQKKLTTLMQSAQSDLAVSGRSRYPFGTVPILVGSALPTDAVSLRLNWPSFEKVDWKSVRILQAAAANILRKPYRLAQNFISAVYAMPVEDRTYSASHFLTVAEALDEMLLKNSGFRGILLQRAEGIVEKIWDDADARDKRFATAAELLMDRQFTEAWIAPSAKEMLEDHLGFRYQKKDGSRWVAFELNTAFPQLMVHLGLRKTESSAFRDYLKNRDFLEVSSQKVRGRDQTTPCAHVLFRAEMLGDQAES